MKYVISGMVFIGLGMWGICGIGNLLLTAKIAQLDYAYCRTELNREATETTKFQRKAYYWRRKAQEK